MMAFGDRRPFIRALAEFLAGDATRKSIELEMGKSSAKEWQALRAASPLRGWVTVEEAERDLTRWLIGPEAVR